MPIRWDAVLVRGMAGELEERLGGARLRAFVLDHEGRTLTLFFREGTLVFRLHPGRGQVLWRPPAEPGSDARPLPAHLRAVTTRPDDRVLVLHFRRVRGRPSRVDVVVELMTNQWNALVAEADSGTIRHALWSRTAGDRALRRGAPYRLPSASDREGAETRLTPERWTEVVGPDPDQARKRLVRGVAYTSGLNAQALVRDGPEAGYAAWSRIQAQPRPEPCLLELPSGLQPYPHVLPGVAATPAAGLLEAMERSAAEEGAPDTTESGLPVRVLQALEARVRRERKRVKELERQRDTAPDPAGLRGAGDLLLARMALVPQGARSATLEGFDGQPVTLELDPKLTPAENARAFYKRAGRAERAAERLPGLLDDARTRARELEDLLERARAGDVSEDGIRERVTLPEAGATGKKTASTPTLPYRRYVSSGGLEIRVGRGARWNDDLTFHHSAPGDVWLHARHASGAHVVLRWSGDENPPARDLEEAAVLAALNSRARTSGSVPVDWTRRKYVRKPRKAPPGSVLVDRARTVFVRPDPAVAEALATDD